MPDVPLHVWVLSDGQPGHYNQSRGIVAALTRLRPVEQHWLSVDLRVGAARNPLRLLLNRLPAPPPTRWLRLFYRMPDLPRAPCDVVVSTGGKTSFANAWLARRMNARNVFAGSLRRLAPSLFDAVLTPEPLVPPVANNLVLDLPPSPLDVEAVDRAAGSLRSRLDPDDRGLWTLMLGGDGAGYRYHEDDWRQLGRLLARLAGQWGIRWLLLGSRRTGGAAETLLGDIVDPRYIADTCWYRQDNAGRVAAYLGAADRVFVTEDSMTMLTEAICSQRPVVSLCPAAVRPTARYAAMIRRFAAQGWICRFAIADLAEGRRSLEEVTCRVLESSPLERLSRDLGERLRLS